MSEEKIKKSWKDIFIGHNFTTSEDSSSAEYHFYGLDNSIMSVIKQTYTLYLMSISFARFSRKDFLWLADGAFHRQLNLFWICLTIQRIGKRLNGGGTHPTSLKYVILIRVRANFHSVSAFICENMTDLYTIPSIANKITHLLLAKVKIGNCAWFRPFQVEFAPCFCHFPHPK